jgi:DNA-binding GntR family transcriptional regulator
VTNPSADEVKEIAEVCRILESHLMRLAVPSLVPDRLARAEACLDELDGIDDPMEWARVNWRFHTTLYEAAQRPLTIEFLTSLRARGDRATLLLVSDKKQRQRLNHEHRFILTSARGGRAELAAALLSTHLRGGLDEALRRMAR